jgi:uncharacterized membrane protein
MKRWAFTDEELRLTRIRVKSWAARASEALVVGAVAVAPLALTLWVLWLVLQVAAFVGGLMTGPFNATVLMIAPGLEGFLLHPVTSTVLNIVVALGALVVIGLMAKGVIGRLVGRMVEDFITRIPVGSVVYGSARQLIASFQSPTEGAQKVVLIEFPSPEMRTVGLVTQRFRASDTGEELAAVYVPTTPNPTSGYVEIVPVDRLVWLDWTLNEAIQFIVSAGVISPETVKYRTTGHPDPQGSPPPIIPDQS